MRLIERLNRLRARVGAEDGAVMLYAIAASVVVMAASAAAFAAVNDDTPLSAVNSSQKQAYQAAQAGIQRYVFDLNQNSEFWTQCVPSGQNWIFNPGDPVPALPQSFAAQVPGSPQESYAVTLLPAVGQALYTKCSTTNPVGSMIQASGNGAGTFRISSTGRAGGQQRTIVAALREQSFLDYSYFTDLETSDPLLQVDEAYKDTGYAPIEPPAQCATDTNPCGGAYANALAGAQAQCSQYRYNGRYTDNKAGYGNGLFYADPQAGVRLSCDQIVFASGDKINGPFHTNDSALVCGGATFGRPGANDAIEFGQLPGYVTDSTCPGSPNFNGVAPTQSIVKIPQTNTLDTVASTVLSGTVCLTLTPTQMLVGYASQSPSQSCVVNPPTLTPMPYPTNGVLYVQNDPNVGCSLTYDVEDPIYTGNTGCGTVYVQGIDGPALTIGTDDDIVVDGNLTYSSPTGASMLGLVATNFVRVYHPVGNQPSGANTHGCDGGTRNAAGSLYNPTIDAMILSLDHSFVVDQYDCGGSLGTLTLLGGIAQEYRGVVGTSGGTGYIKNYQYDDRLRYEEPPHFLTPVEGAWRIERQTECDMASCHALP